MLTEMKQHIQNSHNEIFLHVTANEMVDLQPWNDIKTNNLSKSTQLYCFLITAVHAFYFQKPEGRPTFEDLLHKIIDIAEGEDAF